MTEIVAIYIEIMTRWTEFCMPLIPYCQAVSLVLLASTPVWVGVTIYQYRDEIRAEIADRK
jgi:hypothetical protein